VNCDRVACREGHFERLVETLVEVPSNLGSWSCSVVSLSSGDRSRVPRVGEFAQHPMRELNADRPDRLALSTPVLSAQRWGIDPSGLQHFEHTVDGSVGPSMPDADC